MGANYEAPGGELQVGRVLSTYTKDVPAKTREDESVRAAGKMVSADLYTGREVVRVQTWNPDFVPEDGTTAAFLVSKVEEPYNGKRQFFGRWVQPGQAPSFILDALGVLPGAGAPAVPADGLPVARISRAGG